MSYYKMKQIRIRYLKYLSIFKIEMLGDMTLCDQAIQVKHGS
jgi:hypothetical protein